jgi:Tfp pilus assembly protein PilX
MITGKGRRRSRGLTVVATLTCLIVVTLMSAAILRVALSHRNVVRAQERRLQAEWLAESGVQRAIARLGLDREYAGETWAISPADLGQAEPPPASGTATKSDQSAAVVTITIERVPGASAGRMIRVQADYPRDALKRSRHTEEVTIDLDAFEN